MYYNLSTCTLWIQAYVILKIDSNNFVIFSPASLDLATANHTSGIFKVDLKKDRIYVKSKQLLV